MSNTVYVYLSEKMKMEARPFFSRQYFSFRKIRQTFAKVRADL